MLIVRLFFSSTSVVARVQYKTDSRKPDGPQADTVSLTNRAHSTLSFAPLSHYIQMDSFFPVANPVPSEETQVPIDFDGGGTPGGGSQCTIA